MPKPFQRKFHCTYSTNSIIKLQFLLFYPRQKNNFPHTHTYLRRNMIFNIYLSPIAIGIKRGSEKGARNSMKNRWNYLYYNIAHNLLKYCHTELLLFTFLFLLALPGAVWYNISKCCWLLLLLLLVCCYLLFEIFLSYFVNKIFQVIEHYIDWDYFYVECSI